MTTVLNETFIMNFGGNEAKTPAGNIYTLIIHHYCLTYVFQN